MDGYVASVVGVGDQVRRQSIDNHPDGPICSAMPLVWVSQRLCRSCEGRLMRLKCHAHEGAFEVQPVSPDNGPVQGGTLVNIEGNGFSNAVAPILCNFVGSTSSLVNVVSDGESTSTTPYTVSFGEVNVSVMHSADRYL